MLNFAKQPYDEEDGVDDVNVIEESIDHTLPSNINDDLLQEWLTHFGLVFYEINVFLDSRKP